MLPVYCNGCHKAVAMTMDGLHPFITEVSRCSVYNYTGWVARRGCAFNAPLAGAPKAKFVNPLKASKRGGR